jgi:hypothetical protein
LPEILYQFSGTSGEKLCFLAKESKKSFFLLDLSKCFARYIFRENKERREKRGERERERERERE